MLGSLDRYRTNAATAARSLNWTGDAARILAMIGLRPQRVTILARKRLVANARIARMTETLINGGHKVTIIAPTPHDNPHPEAVYHVVDDGKHWLARMTIQKPASGDVIQQKTKTRCQGRPSTGTR